MLTERDKKVYKWLEEYRAITINQAATMFYSNNYEVCRRRLKELENRKELKSYKSKILNQKVYYQNQKVSEHDLLVLDFAREVVKLGGTLRKFKTQPQYCKGLLRADAYIEFIYKKNVYFVLVEVDYTHFTDYKKIQMYEHLYFQNELQQKCYGTFPILLIIKPIVDLRYHSNNFQIIYTSFQFKNLKRLLLIPD